MPKKINLLGQKFGKLTVIGLSEKKRSTGAKYWICKCDCSKIVTIRGDNLGKHTFSCGCNIRIKEREKAVISRIYSDTIRRRSKLKNIKSDITFEDFTQLIFKPCYYCGMLGSNKRRDTYDSGVIIKYNGLDRIDSSGGYTLNNVVSCCKYCNIAKNDMSVEEFENKILSIYEYFILSPHGLKIAN